MWAGNQRPSPIHPNNQNVRHEIELPALPAAARRAFLEFDYICGTKDAGAAAKAHCKIEILFRYVEQHYRFTMVGALTNFY